MSLLLTFFKNMRATKCIKQFNPVKEIDSGVCYSGKDQIRPGIYPLCSFACKVRIALGVVLLWMVRVLRRSG